MQKRILIIGAGPAGMIAGIKASAAGGNVCILEHREIPGKKILSTGNGRCNMTNLFQSMSCYRSEDPEFPKTALSHFSERDTLSYFHDLGLETIDKNGYVYPRGEQAATVRELLEEELRQKKVTIETDTHVLGIRKEGNYFAVQTTRGFCYAHSVILATGGKAAPKLGSDGSGFSYVKELGHHIIEPLPALVQLKAANWNPSFAGIRLEGRVTIFIDGKEAASDLGEIQLTDYGISGIPVFQVSRFASRALAEGKQVKAGLDFFPTRTERDLENVIRKERADLPHRKAGLFLHCHMNAKAADILLKQAFVSTEQEIGEVSEKKLQMLLKLLKEYPVDVCGTNSFDQSQVSCGGVDVREVDPTTMESKLVKNLYFAGEILDVDGICGGYNLQWAWTSGYLAGSASVREQSSEKLPENHLKAKETTGKQKSSGVKHDKNQSGKASHRSFPGGTERKGSKTSKNR